MPTLRTILLLLLSLAVPLPASAFQLQMQPLAERVVQADFIGIVVAEAPGGTVGGSSRPDGWRLRVERPLKGSATSVVLSTTDSNPEHASGCCIAGGRYLLIGQVGPVVLDAPNTLVAVNGRFGLLEIFGDHVQGPENQHGERIPLAVAIARIQALLGPLSNDAAPIGARELLEQLQAAGSGFITVAEMPDFVLAQDLAWLMQQIDSTLPSAAVVSPFSSYLPRDSTVGAEAAFLIEGFRRGVYPSGTWAKPLDAAREQELRAWWACWSQTLDRAACEPEQGNR